MCSALRMGDNTFIDFLFSNLKNSNEYVVIYNPQNELNFKNIKSLIYSSNKKILLLIPWIHDYPANFYRNLENMLNNCPDGKIQTIIRMHYDFWLNQQKYFKYNSRVFSKIFIEKSFSFKRTKLLIDERRQINGWNIPKKFEKEIYNLSGGIPGIVKHICSFIDSTNSCEINDLLQYPSLKTALLEFREMDEILDKNIIRNMKLLDKKNHYKSILIDEFLLNNRNISEKKLNTEQKIVFDFLLKNNSKLVNLEDISDLLEKKEYSMWGMYKFINRLKKALEPEYQLVNVRSRGYLLKKKNVRDI